MSLQYKAIYWNPDKKRYDLAIATGAVVYLVVFIGAGSAIHPNATAETLIIRATATLAFLLLHIILCIGPLCRLDRRFLPLLYNRRHLGVTMFLVAAIHAAFATFQFHALGDVNPVLSLLTSNPRFDSIREFPFELLGLGALIILFLMAATSHDFWLNTLSPRLWKRLHMMVYVAYGLLVMHVTLGALQSEPNPIYVLLMAAGLAAVTVLHLAAGFKESRADHQRVATTAGLIEACRVADIPEKCAKVVQVGGERVAIFRYDGKISAISNVCAHQNGPLGEGKIIDGCVTCPWHGYQYLPESGASPPPFLEKVPSYVTKVRDGVVYLDPRACAPGTRVEPGRIA